MVRARKTTASKSPAPRGRRKDDDEPSVSAWGWQAYAKGVLVGLLWALTLPLLAVLIAGNTTLEFLAWALRPLCSAPRRALGAESTPPPPPGQPSLVFPGTCTWVFHQMGMTMYLLERYDLSGVRLVGVSSGAVCAAMVCCLERAGPSAAAIAARGDAFFRAFETLAADSRTLAHPTAWLGRLGPVLEAFLREAWAALPETAAPGARVAVGMKRLAAWPLPHLQSVRATGFARKADFIDAVLASCNVFPVTSAVPLRRFRGALCCDGVNPFSLWGSAGEYALQLLAGTARTTAPSWLLRKQGQGAFSSLLDWLYAVVRDALHLPLLLAFASPCILPPSPSRPRLAVEHQRHVCSAAA